jgi:uncharacterized protein (TIGR00369 family)
MGKRLLKIQAGFLGLLWRLIRMGADEQEAMERTLRIMTRSLSKGGGNISAMTRPEFVECDYAKKESLLSFPIQKWELNPGGYLHGGVISTQFDVALSTLAMCFYEGAILPTVQLTVTYMRPVPGKGRLHVRARIVSAGKDFIHAEGEASVPETGDVAAVCKGIFSTNAWNHNKAQLIK